MPMPMPDASLFWAGPVVSTCASPNIPHGFPLHIHLVLVSDMYPYGGIRPSVAYTIWETDNMNEGTQLLLDMSVTGISLQ